MMEEKTNPEEQERIEMLHRETLNWKPVERLPLVVAFPYSKESPVRPFPHREIFDNPEKMY
ncbi:MAG: hypothetical protein RBS73_17495 [Prolixibacteraceae bacterium]|jgi:hypothetical protein|nr:hypothetical protein [Prolixibacteraceae bacterium]